MGRSELTKAINEVELTRQVEALAKRVEVLERGVTVRVRYPDGPLESPVVEVTNGVRDPAPSATGGAR